MENRFHNLLKIFSSNIKTLEILSLLNNKKPSARLLCPEDNIKNSLDFLKQNNLSCLISDFKLIKQNNLSSFYSDKSVKAEKDDKRKGHFIFYISKNKKISEMLKAMEEKNNHKELGLLLGYPECCCNFFSEHFNENNTDLTLDILKNSDGFQFPFYNNICARHFDINLLPHFPCTFNCEKSINIAKNNLELLKKYSEENAALFIKTLKSAVLYSLDSGIFLFNDYNKIKNKIINNIGFMVFD